MQQASKLLYIMSVINASFKEFKIEPGTEHCWERLSFALINKYVPMSQPSKAGRPKSKRPEKEAALYCLYQLYKIENPDLSTNRIIKKVMTAIEVQKLSGILGSSYTDQSIQNRMSAFKKSFAFQFLNLTIEQSQNKGKEKEIYLSVIKSQFSKFVHKN